MNHISWRSTLCQFYNHITIEPYSVFIYRFYRLIKNSSVLFSTANPTARSRIEKESLKENRWTSRRAFSTKARRQIDRKHGRYVLMVHYGKKKLHYLKKRRKKYLAKPRHLHGFTTKKKAELFYRPQHLVWISSGLNAYFSSREREIKPIKIVELVAKADGEYEPEEKQRWKKSIMR
jgi:hypothetical protein